MIEPRRVRRGEPTRVEQYDSLWEFLRAIGLRVVYPLRIQKSGPGAVLTAESDLGSPIWGKTLDVAQTGAVYPWIQQIRHADHTWVDGPLKSTQNTSGVVVKDGLYEVNGNMTIPTGTICEVWRDATSGDFLTQEDACA